MEHEELGYHRPPCPGLSWRVRKNGKRVINFGDWRDDKFVSHGRLREEENEELTEVMEMMEEAWQRLRKIQHKKTLEEMERFVARMRLHREAS